MNFKNIQEFDQYIPNCLICKNKLELFLDCSIDLILKTRRIFPLLLQNDLYISYKDNNPVLEPIVCIKENNIQVYFTSLEKPFLLKKCKDCIFDISSDLLKINKDGYFENYTIDYAGISFYIDNNKYVMEGKDDQYDCYINDEYICTLPVKLIYIKSYESIASKINLYNLYK